MKKYLKPDLEIELDFQSFIIMSGESDWGDNELPLQPISWN